MGDFYIGQEVTEERSFTDLEVRQFAELTGDENPLHIDAQYAQKSRFHGKIVHGIFVAGMISKIIGMRLPGEGSIYLEQKIQFRKPVYIGETITVKVKITDMDVLKNIYTLQTNVYKQDGSCAVKGNAKILYEG